MKSLWYRPFLWLKLFGNHELFPLLMQQFILVKKLAKVELCNIQISALVLTSLGSCKCHQAWKTGWCCCVNTLMNVFYTVLHLVWGKHCRLNKAKQTWRERFVHKVAQERYTSNNMLPSPENELFTKPTHPKTWAYYPVRKYVPTAMFCVTPVEDTD